MKPLTNCSDSELVIVAQKIEEKFRKHYDEAKAIANEYDFSITESDSNIQTVIFSKLKEKRDAYTKKDVELLFKTALEVLSKKGDFTKMSELLALYNEGNYNEVRIKLQGLGLIKTKQEDINRQNRKGEKAPAKILRVTFPDGSVIFHEKAAYTLIEVVEHVGADRIAELNLNIEGQPLVSKNRCKFTQHEINGGWRVTTHSNTAKKKQIIERVSDMLQLDLIVEMV
jgi:hypothetical protein